MADSDAHPGFIHLAGLQQCARKGCSPSRKPPPGFPLKLCGPMPYLSPLPFWHSETWQTSNVGNRPCQIELLLRTKNGYCFDANLGCTKNHSDSIVLRHTKSAPSDSRAIQDSQASELGPVKVIIMSAARSSFAAWSPREWILGCILLSIFPVRVVACLPIGRLRKHSSSTAILPFSCSGNCLLTKYGG